MTEFSAVRWRSWPLKRLQDRRRDPIPYPIDWLLPNSPLGGLLPTGGLTSTKAFHLAGVSQVLQSQTDEVKAGGWAPTPASPRSATNSQESSEREPIGQVVHGVVSGAHQIPFAAYRTSLR